MGGNHASGEYSLDKEEPMVGKNSWPKSGKKISRSFRQGFQGCASFLCRLTFEFAAQDEGPSSPHAITSRL